MDVFGDHWRLRAGKTLLLDAAVKKLADNNVPVYFFCALDYKSNNKVTDDVLDILFRSVSICLKKYIFNVNVWKYLERNSEVLPPHSSVWLILGKGSKNHLGGGKSVRKSLTQFHFYVLMFRYHNLLFW